MLFHQKVAERLGLTVTEFKCFRLVEQLGQLSMTALAHEAGLRLGTVSGLIDKLEAAGFIRRQRDATDKRRLVLVACSDAERGRLPAIQGAGGGDGGFPRHL